MKPRFPVKLAFAAASAAVAGFALGHQPAATVVGPAAASGAPTHAENMVKDASFKSDAPDFSRVRIDHLGELPFVQGYEFLRSAPPEALQQWATDLVNMRVGPHQRAAIRDFFRILAQVDTTTAVDLALALATSDARDIATKAIQAAAPPEGFPAVATLLGSPRSGRGDPATFVDDWSYFDPVSASQFVEGDFPEKDKTDAVMLIAENWAMRDPAAAKAWLDHLDPKDTDKSAYAGLISGWTESDQEAAIRYVIANAAEKKMSEAVTLVAHYLFTDSKDRARDFITALPTDKARQDAVGEIEARATHGRIVFGGPDDTLPADEAARWIATLAPDLQEGHLGPVVSSWYNEHPDAARAWLSTLPPETHDLAAAKGCLAWGWNHESVRANLEMGLAIKNRQLRDKTLREFIDGVKSSDDAEATLATLKLSQVEKAELHRIVGNL